MSPSSRDDDPATHERASVLERIARTLHDRSAELAELITRESGKPIRYARAEVARAALTFTLGAGESRRLGGEVLPIDQLPGTKAACACSSACRAADCGHRAFNFPVNLVAHKLLARARAGRAHGLEARPTKPVTAHALGQWLLEADMPGPSLSVLHMPPESPKSWSRTSAWRCSRSR